MFKFFSRLVGALGIASLAAALVRLRGKGGVPPRTGGWKELEKEAL